MSVLQQRIRLHVDREYFIVHDVLGGDVWSRRHVTVSVMFEGWVVWEQMVMLGDRSDGMRDMHQRQRMPDMHVDLRTLWKHMLVVHSGWQLSERRRHQRVRDMYADAVHAMECHA